MKSIHITQGRFNPVHAGHEMVVKHVMNAAKKDNADHKILTTGSYDAKKNPLTPQQKVKHLSRAVKGAKVEAMGKDAPTLLHQMSKLHKAGYTHVTMHVGSDRVNEFHKLLHQYNGTENRHGHYNFKSIKVKSVGGERSDTGEGIAAASGTAMRKHVTAGDKESFHKMAPSGMSKAHKDALYHDVRKGMGIHESFIERFKNWIS
jgi:nicotinic acid mononucleotide adenylyltransferase